MGWEFILGCSVLSWKSQVFGWKRSRCFVLLCLCVLQGACNRTGCNLCVWITKHLKPTKIWQNWVSFSTHTHADTHRDFRKGHTCTVYIFVCMLRSYSLNVPALISRSSGQMRNHFSIYTKIVWWYAKNHTYHVSVSFWPKATGGWKIVNFRQKLKAHNLLQNLAASTEGNCDDEPNPRLWRFHLRLVNQEQGHRL